LQELIATVVIVMDLMDMRIHVVTVVMVIQQKRVAHTLRTPYIGLIVRVNLNFKLILNHGHTS
jgi:hypothetical protein